VPNAHIQLLDRIHSLPEAIELTSSTVQALYSALQVHPDLDASSRLQAEWLLARRLSDTGHVSAVMQMWHGVQRTARLADAADVWRVAGCQLARCESLAGNHVTAVSHFIAALSVVPKAPQLPMSDPRVLCDLAFLLDGLGEHDAAQRIFETARGQSVRLAEVGWIWWPFSLVRRIQALGHLLPFDLPMSPVMENSASQHKALGSTLQAALKVLAPAQPVLGGVADERLTRGLRMVERVVATGALSPLLALRLDNAVWARASDHWAPQMLNSATVTAHMLAGHHDQALAVARHTMGWVASRGHASGYAEWLLDLVRAHWGQGDHHTAQAVFKRQRSVEQARARERIEAVRLLREFLQGVTGMAHWLSPPPAPSGHIASEPAPSSARPTSVLHARAIERAVVLMSQHLENPLSLQELCRRAGASERSLQHAFQRVYNQAPTAYYRRLRIDGFRRALMAQGGHMPIHQLAAQFGFNHAATLVRVYRQEFGELPSDTLREAMLRPGATGGRKDAE